LPITGFERTTSVITGQCFNQYVLPMRIYILAIPSVTIHNSTHVYQFNINSRKLDGHYRSWIEYLNERY